MRHVESGPSMIFSAPRRITRQIQRLWDTLRGTVNETMQFNLAHVFSSEVLRILDQELHESELIQQLEQMVEHQLKVFAREALGPSIHPPYHATVDKNQWQQGKIDLHDERYTQKNGMLTMSRLAVNTAHSPAEKKRYLLETSQIEQAIYPQVRQLLTAPDIPLLTLSSEEQKWLSHTMPNAQQALFIGEKMAYFLPKNPIYQEDLAFINFCQLVYVPAENELALSAVALRQRLQAGTFEGNLSLVIEPVLGDFSNQDLTDLQTHFSEEKSAKAKTEEFLMSQLFTVPEWVGAGVGRDFVLSVFQEVFSPTHPVVLQAQQRQQSVEQIMHEQSWNIRTGAQFLSRILAQELFHFSGLTATQQVAFAQELPKRLHFAFGLVASPILQREHFEASRAFTSYQKTFLSSLSVEKSAPETLQITPTMRQLMEDKSWLRDVRQVKLTAQDQERISQGLQGMPSFYLNRIISHTACNLFSFGGYKERLALLQTSGAGALMNGQGVTQMGELSRYVSNPEEWKMGVCVNPDCQAGGLTQLVGPCDICLGCQMRFELAEMAQEGTSPTDTAMWPDFSQQMGKTLQMWQQSFRPSDILPSFLTPPSKQFQASSVGSISSTGSTSYLR